MPAEGGADGVVGCIEVLKGSEVGGELEEVEEGGEAVMENLAGIHNGWLTEGR